MKRYSENITLDINNGLHQIDLYITGEGVPLNLHLEKPDQKLVDFGIRRIGDDITKVIYLVNFSRKPITISFDVNDQLKDFEKYYLSVLPTQAFTINPR